MPDVEPFKLEPIFKERVWGGTRLVPGASSPVGEAWVVYEENVVDGGVWDGRTLGAVTDELGAMLLGESAAATSGKQFPLLIKLLDSQDWLSVQVHPNDEQAAQLEGPGTLGKTESWYVLEADPGAKLISGLSGAPTSEDLREAIQAGSLERYLNYVDVRAGDAFFTPAGQVHAIGPGLLIYEVQQTSDITYRLYDWNRPASQGRELHLDKGLSVVATDPAPVARPFASPSTKATQRLVDCPYFILDRVEGATGTSQFHTGKRSFHALTVIGGEVVVEAARERYPLAFLETLLVPAAIADYKISSEGPFQLLCARVA